MQTLIRRQALVRGAAPFLEDARPDDAQSARMLSYADLDTAARQWASWLHEQAIPVGASVLVDVDDPIDFAIAHLAIISSGRCSVPIDPAAPAGDLVRTIAATQPVLVVSDRARHEDIGSIPSLVLAAGRPPTWGELVDYDAPAGSVRLSTSGSTGEPKVVHLEGAQLLHVGTQVATHNQLTARDRGYNCLPLFHINAQVVGLLSTLVAGATLVLDRRFHRTGFWALMEQQRISWINAVPAILAILAHDPPARPVPTLRFVRSASAPLPDAVRRSTESALRVPVVESYGMTEAASQITATPLNAPRRAGSAGVPVGVELQVRAGTGPAPAGEVGGVWIRGPGVITSYLDGRAAERFDAQGWLDTGDLGHLDDDGYLYLVGRADDVINRGGEMVYPREVEEVLLGDPRVVEAALVAEAHDVLGAVPVAYLLLRADVLDVAGLIDDLESRCREQLSPFKRPARFQIVDDLPRAATGKVRRDDLRRRQLATAGPTG